MIHVAPCSCELHVALARAGRTLEERATRIRELETEALFRQADLAELKARAEKAEKDREDYAENWAAIKITEERLKARVAELERLRGPYTCPSCGVEWTRFDTEDHDKASRGRSDPTVGFRKRHPDFRARVFGKEREPAPASEGREREAD